jgi:hypothetical protein
VHINSVVCLACLTGGSGSDESMYAEPQNEEGTLRASEVEILRSMYSDIELRFPDPEDNFEFVLSVTVDGEAGGDDEVCELFAPYLTYLTSTRCCP